jgi:hypothetical protein
MSCVNFDIHIVVVFAPLAVELCDSADLAGL